MKSGCRKTDFSHTIGGTSRLLTGGRHVVTRLEACTIETRKLSIIEKDVQACDYDSLQAALDCITSGTEGCINLIIKDGLYTEALALSDNSGVKLTLCGSLEDQFARGYQADKTITGPAAFGTGEATLVSAANVITITTGGDAPALNTLNIVAGDTILLHEDDGSVVRRTISSVTANTITLTSNVSVGTTGSGFVFLPRVHINGGLDTLMHTGKVTLKGVYITGTVLSTVAPVCLTQSVLRATNLEASEGALSLKGAAIPRSDLRESSIWGSRGLTVERIHGIEALELMFFVPASTQEGWAVRLDEGSVGFIGASHLAGQPTGSLVVTNNDSFLDLEDILATVNLSGYDQRVIRADLNSTVNIHDDSIVEIVDPAADARHASAINDSSLTICGEVEFIGNSVATQSAVEAANGGRVTADHSNIVFTDIVGGDEYDVDTLPGIAGNTMAASPIVGPSASGAIINTKI